MSPSIEQELPQNTGEDATQQHPGDIDPQDPTAPYRAIYGERYEKLPQQLVNAIRECFKGLAGQDSYMRRVEVIRDRKNRFYEKGIQHIFTTNGGGFVQASSGALINCAQGSIQCGEFVDDYDITSPYCRIMRSVLTQNIAGVAFEPMSATRAEDMSAAQQAEDYWGLFQRSNDLRQLQTAIIRYFQTSSRAVSWTRTEADAQKFGNNPDGTPKRMEVATIHGTLEHKCPVLAKSLSACLFNALYDDPDVIQMKAEYPNFAPKIQANVKGLGEDEYERQARVGVLQGTRLLTQVGESISHIATRANVWLRPAALCDGKWDKDAFTEPLPGDPGAAPGESIKDALNRLFPQGIHAQFVGDTYVGSWDESTDDALDIQFPVEGDGMFRQAILDPFIVIQDSFNDDMNAFREVANYGWPSTWVNADETQYKAIEKQISAPYAFRQFELNSRQDDIRKAVYREQDPSIPPTLYELTQFLQGPLAQFVMASPPSLWGEAMQDQKTASGYHLAASQAMGQMGLWFGRIQRMFSRIAYQAALCAARNPDHQQQTAVPGADGPQLSSISKERFRAFPDEDSSFPESTIQKRAQFDQILEMLVQDPVLGQQFMSVPGNVKEALKLKGFPEITMPQAVAADAAQFVIEQLLQQSGQRSDAAMMTATQTGADPMAIPPDAPSIQPDPLSYHDWEFAYCQLWLNSGKCRDELAKGNLAGVQNVRLYAQAQQALIPPPPMPMLPGKPALSAPGGPQQAPTAPAAPEAPLAAPTAL